MTKEIDPALQTESLPDKMIFTGGKIDKMWFLPFAFIFMCFGFYLTFAKSEKITTGNIFGFLFIALILGVGSVLTFFDKKFKDKIIISKEGVTLQDYPLTPWDRILDTFIVSIGTGKSIRYFFVVSIDFGIYRDQEFGHGSNNYGKLSHFTELYKLNKHSSSVPEKEE